MKNIIKAFIVSAIVFAIAIFSVTPTFATGTLEINGVKKIQPGDSVRYELNLADCEEDVVGLQMYIFYEQEYLEIVNDSLKFPELSNVVSNEGRDYITFNWTDVSNTADFSEKKVLASVDFQVIKGGETEISYFVSELYGEDMTYLKSFSFTYDLSVNKEVKIDDETPILSTEESANNLYQGQFINYVDGKGEKNGKGENRETVSGVTEAPSIPTLPTNAQTEQLEGSTIFVTISIVVLVLAIIALVILRRVFTRDTQQGVNVASDENDGDNDD